MCGQRRSSPRSSDRPVWKYVYSENPAQEPPQQEVIKNYGLSESARVLARRAPEAEIQARSRQSRDSSKIDNVTTYVVVPSAAVTENNAFDTIFAVVIGNHKNMKNASMKQQKNTL